MQRINLTLPLSEAIAVIAFALAAACVHAAPTPSVLGESAALHLSLTTSARYDDNLFLSSSNPRADTIVSAAPGATLNWGDASARHLGLAVQENFVRYLRGSSENDSLASIQMTSGLAGARSHLGLSAGFEQTRGNTRDLRSTIELARHDRTTWDLSASYELTPKTSLQTGVTFEDDKFRAGDFHSTRQISYPLTLAYVLSPKMSLNGNYRYQDVSVSGSGLNFTNHLLGLGASGEFTPKVSGHVGANWTRHARILAPAENTLGFDCSLAWDATPRMNWAATASRNFQASPGTGFAYSSTRFGLQNSWSLAEFWSAQTGIQYEIAQYGAARGDRLVASSLAVNYVPSSFATFSAGYIFELNRSDVARTNYERNAVNLSASFRY